MIMFGFYIAGIKNLSQHPDSTLYTLVECLHLLARVVHRNRGTAHTRNAIVRHNRFGTVLTCADGYAQLIENHSQIVVVNTLDIERYNRAFILRRAINFQAINLL